MSAPHLARLRVRTEGVTWRDVGGEVVALDLISSVYFSTNRTGRMMWHLLLEWTSAEQLVAALIAEYEITAAQAEHDVAAFVSSLERHGLLEIAE